MKENKLNNIEQQLRDKLNDASFDYQEQHWAQLQSNLNQSGGASGSFTWLKIAAFVVLSAAGAYYFLSDSNEQTELKSATQETENTIQEIKPKTLPLEDNSKIETEIANSSTPTESVKNTQEDVIEQEDIVELEVVEENETIDIAETEHSEVIKEETTEDLPTEETIKLEEDKPIENLIVQGSFCLGSEVQVIVNSEENEANNYSWTIGDQVLETNASSISITIENTGIYEISVSNGINKKTVDFEVLTLPEIDFTYQDSNDPYWDEAAQLNATPANLDYTWDIEGMENHIQGNNQTVDFETEGLYDIELIYTDNNGCQTHLIKPVSIQTDFDPLAPNVFTPNGDGLNDDFIPKGFIDTEGSFKMSIYNLSGKKIYETKSKENPWNGKENNVGSELIDGIYVWKIEISNETRNKAFTGHVKKTSF